MDRSGEKEKEEEEVAIIGIASPSAGNAADCSSQPRLTRRRVQKKLVIGESRGARKDEGEEEEYEESEGEGEGKGNGKRKRKGKVKANAAAPREAPSCGKKALQSSQREIATEATQGEKESNALNIETNDCNKALESIIGKKCRQQLKRRDGDCTPCKDKTRKVSKRCYQQLKWQDGKSTPCKGQTPVISKSRKDPKSPCSKMLSSSKSTAARVPGIQILDKDQPTLTLLLEAIRAAEMTSGSRRDPRGPEIEGPSSGGNGDSSDSGMRRRGPTKAEKTWSRLIGQRHNVLVDGERAFCGVKYNEFKAFCTTITHSADRMPLVGSSNDDLWKPYDWASPALAMHKDAALREILGRFRFVYNTPTFEELSQVESRALILSHLNKSWRQYKVYLRKRWKKKSLDELMLIKPVDMSSSYAQALYLHFNSEEFKKRSEKASASRRNLEVVHVGGSRTISQWCYEEESAGRPRPDRIARHDMYYNRSQAADQNRRLHEHLSQVESSQGGSSLTPLQHREAVDHAIKEVFGPDCHGRVRLVHYTMTPTMYHRRLWPVTNGTTFFPDETPSTRAMEAEQSPQFQALLESNRKMQEDYAQLQIENVMLKARMDRFEAFMNQYGGSSSSVPPPQ